MAKHKKGANVPDGNTNFQFQAGNQHFHSTSYDWLVVAGQNKAKFKGSGTVNGAGAFKFMLTAIDNGNSGDRFHIKVWDVNGVLYDNLPSSGEDAYDGTVLGGGNIQVHKNYCAAPENGRGRSRRTAPVSYCWAGRGAPRPAQMMARLCAETETPVR